MSNIFDPVGTPNEPRQPPRVVIITSLEDAEVILEALVYFCHRFSATRCYEIKATVRAAINDAQKPQVEPPSKAAMLATSVSMLIAIAAVGTMAYGVWNAVMDWIGM